MSVPMADTLRRAIRTWEGDWEVQLKAFDFLLARIESLEEKVQKLEDRVRVLDNL